MPWNFFITPANYWELKLGTNSQSTGNFSSNELSNTTGMFLKSVASAIRFNYRSTRTFGSRLSSVSSSQCILVQIAQV